MATAPSHRHSGSGTGGTSSKKASTDHTGTGKPIGPPPLTIPGYKTLKKKVKFPSGSPPRTY